jgi:glycine cleavage system H protein
MSCSSSSRRSARASRRAARPPSSRAASEVYAPVAGEVVEVNGELEGAPGTVNEDPKGRGWFMKMRIADPAQLGELMTEDQYNDYVASL